MILRLPTVAGLTAVGHGAALGLMWALVNVPEATLTLLALSAALALLILFVIGWTEMAALNASRAGSRLGQNLAAGLRTWPACLPGIAIVLAGWWLTGLATERLSAARGEIDAVLLLHLTWVRTGALHAALAWVAWWLRYPVVLSLAAGAMAAAQAGTRTLLRPGWIGRALAWRRLALATATALACFYLPWRVLDWRPSGLPATWVEPALVAVKLLLLYIWAHVGWAVMLRRAARDEAPRPDGAGS